MTDKLELKSCHEVIDTVDVANIESIFHGKPTDQDILTVVMKDGKRLYCDEVCPIDSLQKEPVSEDLEEASMQYGEELDNILAVSIEDDNSTGEYAQEAFNAGAQWQKQKTIAQAVAFLIKHSNFIAFHDIFIGDFCKTLED